MFRLISSQVTAGHFEVDVTAQFRAGHLNLPLDTDLDDWSRQQIELSRTVRSYLGNRVRGWLGQAWTVSCQ